MENVSMLIVNNLRRQLIHQSASEPPFYLLLTNYHYDESIKTTIYEFEFAILSEDKNYLKTFHMSYRFSELYNLYEYLNQKYNTSQYNLTFPRKKWFFSNSVKTQKERAEQLNEYFSKVPRCIENLIDDAYFVSRWICNA